MDIKDYILSGAIESYVLGLASPEEMQELETMAAQHPEVKKALYSFEESLEKSSLENAVTAPDFLYAKVMKALENEGLSEKVPQITGENLTASTTQTQPAKVIPITYAPKGIMWLRGAIAACIILLIGSSIINFYFYSKYREYNNKYTTLLAENTTLTAKAKAIEASYNLVKDPEMKLVTLAAVPAKPGSLATVYWDSRSKDVWLMVNNLPQTPSNKQYQLWAIVDGKPVDAGMLDLAKTDELIKMKNIPNAQAFAITLETKGGSPTPHLDQLYVMGKT